MADGSAVRYNSSRCPKVDGAMEHPSLVYSEEMADQ